ncbi:sperm flagellar protein 1-like isoform X2 [Lineus longissimus]|uniref:sperm flagellar protein 1-like isoform X2 n=1 Tax=Lineus longissimus TaxID=88925 RepID=UPI00315C6FA6
MEAVDDEVLEDLYTWVDEIPLSRPKRNITRDFSDGVLVAETMKHFFPKLVELHNYPAANSTEAKVTNWKLLNRKVLKKLNMELSEDVIRSIATNKPSTVERVLLIMRSKIDKILLSERNRQVGKGQYSDRPEADQGREMDGYLHQHHQSQHDQGSVSGQHARVSPNTKMPQPGARGLGQPEYYQYRDEPNVIGSSHSQPHKFIAGPSKMSHPHHHVTPRANITKAQATSYTSDFVPRLIFEEKSQECLAKEETISILQAKIRRLEHLLHLKDIRIDDLTCRLEQLRPTNQHLGSPTAVRKKASNYGGNN